MLLYTIYTPNEQHNNSWNRARVYAFASVERLVGAIHEVAYGGTGYLEIVTKAAAYRASTIGRLYTGIGDNGIPLKDGAAIHVNGDGVRDSWDGSIVEIQLAQTIDEENISKIAVYA